MFWAPKIFLVGFFYIFYLSYFTNFFRCLFKKRRNKHFENFQLWKIYPVRLDKWATHFNCWSKFQRVVTFDWKVRFSHSFFLNWSIFERKQKFRVPICFWGSGGGGGQLLAPFRILCAFFYKKAIIGLWRRWKLNILIWKTHNIFVRSKKVNKIDFMSVRRKLPKSAHLGAKDPQKS